MKNSGWRKPTPTICMSEQHADAGEQGRVSRAQAFTAAKKIGAHLGLKPGELVLLDLFAAFSKPQDWEDGQKPIVWPSNDLLMEQTGFSRSALKRYVRRLGELGLIRFHDSPNGKRWGKRDAYGDIVEAYGFDLSPLAYRVQEFERMHQHLVHERQACKRLRREITSIKRTVAEYIITVDDKNPLRASDCLEQLDQLLAQNTRGTSTSQELSKLLVTLTALHDEIIECRTEPHHPNVTETSQDNSTTLDHLYTPMGSNSEPHIQHTNKLQNKDLYEDTLKPNENSSSDRTERAPIQRNRTERKKRPNRPLDPMSVLAACPQFAEWHRSDASKNDWSSLVRTALKLAPMIAVHPDTTSRAIAELGENDTVTAIAIITEKVTNGHVHKPNAYLAGMIRKARTGHLNLPGSIRGYLSENRTTPKHTQPGSETEGILGRNIAEHSTHRRQRSDQYHAA